MSDTTLWIAELETRHFHFTAVGATEVEAREVMRRAWKAHADQYQAGDQWTDVADGVVAFPVRRGLALRDGEPFDVHGPVAKLGEGR